MGARGRPSAAELSVVAFEKAEARRPDPPELGLTEEQPLSGARL
jgi:hypothetical protein